MPPFTDRHDAGRQLAQALQPWKGHADTIIIALPRGGIPVAFEVCATLHLPLDITYPRKIGAPGNPEYAIGAITESGEGLIHHDHAVQAGATKDYIREMIAYESDVATKRLATFRQHLPKQDLRGKTAIIVDDGIATGSTMQAAIVSVREEGASHIIAAVPVAAPDSVRALHAIADEVVALDEPPVFMAVGQFYESFGETTEEEILELLVKLKNK